MVSLGLLDTDPQERFDRVTRLARRLFDVDVALVTLLDADRQWFLSKQGTELAQTTREVSFCGHAIHEDDVFHVYDATSDQRFADNPLVVEDPSIRFYAGQPIRGPGGHRVGTLCLIGKKPRGMDADERATLRDLAGVVEDEISATHVGTTDELTGLTNRRGFDAVAGQVLEVCRRSGREATMLFADLDGLKTINDSFGHTAGDRALRAFAQILDGIYRASDVVARFGGDEFAVLLTGADRPDPAIPKLLWAIDAFNDSTDEPYRLGVSVGSTRFRPQSDDTIDTLVGRADVAMYENKQRP